MRFFAALLICTTLLGCAESKKRTPAQIPNQPTGGCNTNDPACMNLHQGKMQGDSMDAYRAERSRIQSQTVIKTFCKLFDQISPCNREWFTVSDSKGNMIVRERGPEIILPVKKPIDIVIQRDGTKQVQKAYGVTAGKVLSVEFD